MSHTSVELPYAQPAMRAVRVPDDRLFGIFRVKAAPVEKDIRSAVTRALHAPIDSPSLRDILSSHQPDTATIAIVVDDNTRPTPVAQILPTVIEEIERAGYRRENVSITVALGTHRAMNRTELLDKVGKEIFERYLVQNSHYYDSSGMSFVGTSADGNPIFIDRLVAAATVRIGIGSIVPHGAVGWSGGAKILFPGVAGAETVMRFHFAHGLSGENMQGRLECSVRLAMERWVETIGLDFIVNTVLDQSGRVCQVVAGHFVAAQRAGASFGRTMYHHEVPRRAQVVVVVSHPHDADFWQAAKGIFAAEQLTADGGHLILVSPCTEGEGNHPLFIDRIGDPTIHEQLRQVAAEGNGPPEDPVSIAPACLLEMITRRITVHLVSTGIPPSRLIGKRIEGNGDVQSLIDQLIAENPRASVAFVMHSDLSFSAVESASIRIDNEPT